MLSISPVPYAMTSGCVDLKVTDAIMSTESAQCVTVSLLNFVSEP